MVLLVVTSCLEELPILCLRALVGKQVVVCGYPTYTMLIFKEELVLWQDGQIRTYVFLT